MSPTTTEPTKPAFDFGKLRARWLREQEKQQRLSWELAARVGTVTCWPGRNRVKSMPGLRVITSFVKS